MNTRESTTKAPDSAQVRIGSVFRAKCPRCHTGSVLKGVFAIRERCPECDYNFHPEPGFYLGAMMVGFLLTAILTVPPLIVLKLLNVDIVVLMVFPFIEFAFIGTFLMFYSRILWLHLEYKMTRSLEQRDELEHRKH